MLTVLSLTKISTIFLFNTNVKYVRVLNQISILDGKVAAFQGGVLVREQSSGEIVGAVGISGAAGDEDEYCAIYGVDNCAMGVSKLLVTEPAEHSCKTLSKL